MKMYCLKFYKYKYACIIFNLKNLTFIKIMLEFWTQTIASFAK